jgi:ADP-heptose:LPS heptosyltransferase
LNVGIVWRGTYSNKKVDNQRQIPLNLLLNYLPKGLNYHCLQKELTERELSKLSENSINFYSDYLVDFSDTAAICCNLDLVVTIDTSIAHLAGALGIKTYLLLATSSDWRWHLEGTDSLWYKSIRIFRQDKVENWNNVLFEIKEELLKLI